MSDTAKRGTIGAALVVGGGIGGMQAALDLAENGIKVYLAEAKSGIGGVMSQLDKTFPTSDCAMCTMAPRLAEISRHRDVEIITLADVERIAGGPGNFTVSLRRKARYVDETKCTGCGTCVSNCPTRYRVQPVADADRERIELSPEVQEQVGAILGRWRDREGSLMPILQEVNALLHYFPADVLKLIARETGHPLTHLYRLATFYGSFSIVPRGRHTINVCMGTTCYVRGSERLLERFGSTLGIEVDGTTADGLFTLKAVRCIGCCGLAPAVAIGDEVHGKLLVKDVRGVVERHREAGS